MMKTKKEVEDASGVTLNHFAEGKSHKSSERSSGFVLCVEVKSLALLQPNLERRHFLYRRVTVNFSAIDRQIKCDKRAMK